MGRAAVQTAACRADTAGHVDRQALAGELVDQGEAFQALAVGTSIEDEVVGRDLVSRCGRKGTRP
jgi:hypothetical protein